MSVDEELEAAERVLVAKLEQLRALKDETSTKKTFGLTVPDVLSRLKGEGKRYPTGFPSIDARIGGGLPRGKMAVVVGKPGAGKTSITIQAALNVALSAPEETAILAVFHDSGLEDACLTIAQQCGATREQAQNGEALDVVRFTLDRIRMTLVDVGEPYALEDVVERWIQSLPPGTVPILIVDSAQVVRTKAGDRERSQFDKVRVISDVVRTLTNRHRTITFLVSQANRGAYKNKAQAGENDPLASGSGSGNLEFMPDLHLFLEIRDGRILLKCQKNRLGEEQEFSVVLGNDKARHRHLEIDSADIAQEIDEKHEARMRGIEVLVLKELKRNPRSSTRDLRETVKAKASDVSEAIKRLYATGSISRESGPRGANLWFSIT